MSNLSDKLKSIKALQESIKFNNARLEALSDEVRCEVNRLRNHINTCYKDKSHFYRVTGIDDSGNFIMESYYMFVCNDVSVITKTHSTWYSLKDLEQISLEDYISSISSLIERASNRDHTTIRIERGEKFYPKINFDEYYISN